VWFQQFSELDRIGHSAFVIFCARVRWPHPLALLRGERELDRVRTKNLARRARMRTKQCRRRCGPTDWRWMLAPSYQPAGLPPTTFDRGYRRVMMYGSAGRDVGSAAAAEPTSVVTSRWRHPGRIHCDSPPSPPGPSITATYQHRHHHHHHHRNIRLFRSCRTQLSRYVIRTCGCDWQDHPCMTIDHVTFFFFPFLRCDVVVLGCVVLICFVKLSFIFVIYISY